MSSWHSPQKIYTLGHGALRELFYDPVTLTEKVDGSFLAAGVYDGQLRVRSRGQELLLDAPDKMFIPGIEATKSRQHLLRDGWQYRGEYLAKPKQTSLTYNRIPTDHIILFDILTDEETYLPYDELATEADRIGLEVVPCYHDGRILPEDARATVERFLETESCLGGQRVEGVVIKNRHRFGVDGKALFGKYVSDAFKEVHAREWKAGNPKSGDLIVQLTERYRTPARWAKAIYRLRDEGRLEWSPRDIGNLIKAVREDVEVECVEEIKEFLYYWAKPIISRAVTAGLPEFYKRELFDRQFSPGEEQGGSA